LQRVDPHGIKLALGLTHLAGCYEQTDHMDLSKAAEKREAARLVLDRNFATAQDKKTIEALMDLNEELLICDYVNQNKLEQGKQVLAQMKQRFKHNQRQTNDQITWPPIFSENVDSQKLYRCMKSKKLTMHGQDNQTRPHSSITPSGRWAESMHN
jgi:hypothetical protein